MVRVVIGLAGLVTYETWMDVSDFGCFVETQRIHVVNIQL